MAIEAKKYVRGLIDGFVEEVLLKVQESFFMKFAARNKKVYICNVLKNSKSISMKKVSARLKGLSSYLKRFPKPENMSFSSG